MAARKTLIERVRVELNDVRRVKEKKMFGSVAFMVNDKMCVNARDDRIMCRIDPELHDRALKRDGCCAVVMRGRPCRGYVHVDANVLGTRRALRYWIDLALEFNEYAVSSKQSRRRVKA